MWLLFLPILLNVLVIQAIQVFTFNGTSESSATTSFASLVSEVDLPHTFVLCSSIKQARFDHVGFYIIPGKDYFEWMRVEFRTFSKSIKLALRWDGKFFYLDKLQNPRLDHWYHICLSFDLTKNEVNVAVNGVEFGRVFYENLTNIPNKLKMTIGKGDNEQQFQGSVANIQVFKEGNATDLSALPCKLRQSTILPWNPNNWKVIGSHWSLVEEFEKIFCVPSDHYNLAIPSKITINESMNICKHKLNNSVIPFHKDAETFLKYIVWHKNTSGGVCSNVWTPFSDQQSEGSFLNMNNNATVEFQVWDKTEPNGGRVENYAVIDIPRAALDDVPRSWVSCSSCLLSSSMLLKLDGLCKDSVIGNVQIKETILNLKSYFHTQTTSTRS